MRAPLPPAIAALALATAALATAACDAGPVGDKAAADNRAFQDEEDGGFFSSLLGSNRKATGSDQPGIPGQCRFSGWAANGNPAGTPIRSGPGRAFPVVGTLPPARETDAGLYGIEAATFDVVEAKNGWFRIDKAVYQRLDFDEEPVVYPAGWIAGADISFAVQSDYAFEHPDPRAPRVASGWNDPNGANGLRFHTPQDCQGEWVKLTVAGYDGVEKPGWLRGLCGRLETACEDLASDNAERPGDLPTYATPPVPTATPTPAASGAASGARPVKAISKKR